MPTWPVDLPQEFERDGYREQLGDQIIRSSLSQGKPKSRRPGRLWKEGEQVRGHFIMTSTEWEILENFYEDTLSGGIFAFGFPKPDKPGEMIRVDFEESPSLVNIGGDTYEVSIVLNVL